LTPILQNERDPTQMGIPFFPQDGDGIVRRFQDGFAVANQPKPVPSLSCAIARAYDSRVECKPDEERRFSFTGDRFHFMTVEAGEILSEDQPVWRTRIDLTNSIVLVGGRYRAARDVYVTPAGEMAGVEVVANAAQSYLKDGRSLLDAPWLAGALFDVFIGTLVIWLYWRFRMRTAFWLSITAAPVVAMILSFLVFLTLRYWLAFMPVLLGMILHEMYDHAEHIQELESAERRVERLSSLFRRRSRYRPRDHSEP
jgi:CHASE2 domain-containing sensor protein